MEQTIKAIETVYKGYRFRSRLEARWACFYDALGIKWEYEKEGYILGDGTKYLPDFYLPDYGWIEIKGDYPTDEERDKLSNLVEITKERGFLFFGPIPEDDDIKNFNFTDSAFAYFYSPDGIGGDQSYIWCECPTCGNLGIQFDGRSARNKHQPDCEILRLRNEGRDHPIYGRTDDKVYNAASPRLLRAYQKARAARFEFGESGL